MQPIAPSHSQQYLDAMSGEKHCECQITDRMHGSGLCLSKPYVLVAREGIGIIAICLGCIQPADLILAW